MRISPDTTANAASVHLRDIANVRAVDLPHATIAFVSDDGELAGIETHDASHWGERWDLAAAERLVAWVQAQLANAAA